MRCDHELCTCTESPIARDGKFFCSEACVRATQDRKQHARACSCEHTECAASRDRRHRDLSPPR